MIKVQYLDIQIVLIVCHHFRTSDFRAATAFPTFRDWKPVATPMACFVRSWNRFSEPGLAEHDGGGKFNKSCSRCVLPTWNKHDGRITTEAEPSPLSPIGEPDMMMKSRVGNKLC